ncbi:MAG TPA: TPM domain-containing protein [Chthoniobacterales bacterium]|jgi:uncharacterized membrane protein
MQTHEFLSKVEHDRVVRSIRDAEANTSGEIRVYVERGQLNGDPLIAAQKQFHRVGMHRTADRNAVLIYVAPRAHKFAVVGDKAIHEKCGEELWHRLVDRMQQHFRNENFTDALIEGIQETGKALAAHFPKRSTSTELPDEVIER